MPMETSMKASGSMTKLMAMEHTSMPMELLTSVNGKRTSNTALVLKSGQTVQNTKVSTMMERSTEMVA